MRMRNSWPLMKRRCGGPHSMRQRRAPSCAIAHEAVGALVALEGVAALSSAQARHFARSRGAPPQVAKTHLSIRLQSIELCVAIALRGGSIAMIEVYSWATPNGHKVHIMLEECGLPIAAIAVDIGAGDQFKPEFLEISPNNKIPAIVDPDGPDGKPIRLFESGAILLYLAGKTGRFLPADLRGRYEMLEWLMFQMGGVGPDAGPGAPLPHLRAREDRLRRRPLHQRGQAPLRRDGQAPREVALHRRRRVRHRRHGDLPVAALVEEPGHRAGPSSRTSRAGSTRSRRGRR